ncbi:hypothetical protein F5X98DRAFT_44979 [Xylaria grammica]|nr:hypothetical protein F5X98DRAFT_44979 [Xylaria grammica]
MCILILTLLATVMLLLINILTLPDYIIVLAGGTPTVREPIDDWLGMRISLQLSKVVAKSDRDRHSSTPLLLPIHRKPMNAHGRFYMFSPSHNDVEKCYRPAVCCPVQYCPLWPPLGW